MLHCLAFDIETVPDTEFGRRLYALPDMSDADVAEYMFFRRRQQTGHEFLPLPQQRVVAISVAMRRGESFRVWSLGEADAGEKELLERFFDGIQRYSPTLVSWNGSGFDLPVMHYRSLLHGLSAPRYWESGENDQSFRWNNYLNRFHARHTDLMDVLAGYQGSGRARLEEVAVLLGLPGKLGMSGAKVWPAWRDGQIAAIRNYCETDALNTYLVYLHVERLRGTLDDAGLAAEQQRVREVLSASGQPHFEEFLRHWQPQV
jgi:3'-5' exonuclease